MATQQDVIELANQLAQVRAELAAVQERAAQPQELVTQLAGITAQLAQTQQTRRTGGEDLRLGKPEAYVPGNDYEEWEFTFLGYCGTVDPELPELLRGSRVMSDPVVVPTEQAGRAASVYYMLTMLTKKGARKIVRRVPGNGLEAFRQLSRTYGSADKEGTTGLFVLIMTFSFGERIDQVEERLNEFVELAQRYDSVNDLDPVPDMVKKATLVSNTPEPLRTHLQLHASKMRDFDEARVMCEDYLRSRRMFRQERTDDKKEKDRDDNAMDVDALWRKGKGKGKGKGKEKGHHGEKGKRQGQGQRQGQRQGEDP